jgi:competence protein ComEC
VWAALAAAATSLVLLASGSHALAREAGPVAALAEQRSVVLGTGIVASEPVVRTGRTGQTAVLQVLLTEVSGRGQQSRVRTPVLVLADEDWAGLRWRERIEVRGRLEPAQPADEAVAVLRPMSSPRVVGRAGAIARGAEHLRAGLREAAAPLPADARGLLPALVIGDTSRTPEDLTEAMLATGMTHLSAVSGDIASGTLLCDGDDP